MRLETCLVCKQKVGGKQKIKLKMNVWKRRKDKEKRDNICYYDG